MRWRSRRSSARVAIGRVRARGSGARLGRLRGTPPMSTRCGSSTAFSSGSAEGRGLACQERQEAVLDLSCVGREEAVGHRIDSPRFVPKQVVDRLVERVACQQIVCGHGKALSDAMNPCFRLTVSCRSPSEFQEGDVTSCGECETFRSQSQRSHAKSGLLVALKAVHLTLPVRSRCSDPRCTREALEDGVDDVAVSSEDDQLPARSEVCGDPRACAGDLAGPGQLAQRRDAGQCGRPLGIEYFFFALPDVAAESLHPLVQVPTRVVVFRPVRKFDLHGLASLTGKIREMLLDRVSSHAPLESEVESLVAASRA